MGQSEIGLIILAEAFEVVDKTGDRSHEAELYRLKGDLTLHKQSSVRGLKSEVTNSPASRVQSPKSAKTKSRLLDPNAQSEAEACFLKAINIAQHQQAKSLELRATTSLARLWQQQGKAKPAHKVLSVVYNWFTERLDTKDLQEAKALLASLGSNV